LATNLKKDSTIFKMQGTEVRGREERTPGDEERRRESGGRRRRSSSSYKTVRENEHITTPFSQYR
jgi:hypothetical protein